MYSVQAAQKSEPGGRSMAPLASPAGVKVSMLEIISASEGVRAATRWEITAGHIIATCRSRASKAQWSNISSLIARTCVHTHDHAIHLQLKVSLLYMQ
jgi:hypothetical protein